MFDWNGNGKEDWGDRYIDYQIYNDIYNNDDDNQPNDNDNDGCAGCLSPIIMFFVAFMIWNILTN